MADQMSEFEPELEPVVAALKRFMSAFSALAMEMLLKLDLTMPQARALQTIDRLGRASGRQLARELGVSPASVVPLCDRLERHGYVQRIRDTADRRICWFQPTPAGADALQHRPAIRSRILPVLAGLSAGDRECLQRVLDALAAAIDVDQSAPDVS